MKTILFSTLLLLFTIELMGQNNSFQLPKEWDKSFVISLANTGSMSGSSSHLKFTFDSCSYEATSLHAKAKKKSFLLSAKDRELILAKMRELKVDIINAKRSIVPQNDGWSTLLCLGSHCIEGGSSSEMSEDDKNRFLDACHFLEEFAVKKK